MLSLRIVPKIAGVLVFALAWLAQTPVPQTPAPPQQQPTFRTRVDAVSVDVIVTDRQGNPVTDLTAADFEVREAGKMQSVDSFKFIKVDDGYDDPKAARNILSFDDQRRETGREDNRLFVIMLDDYHTRLGNSMRVREQLVQFTRTLTPHDLVAVATPITPMELLTFSRNHNELASMMMAFTGRKYDYTPKNAMEERYTSSPPETQERMRNDLTISALEGLCLFMGALRDGRKTILYVSEGLSSALPAGVATKGTLFPRPQAAAPTENTQMQDSQAFFNSTQLLADMRRVFQAAGRANVSIYTLDPRGLATSEFQIDDNVGSGNDRKILNESMDMLRTIAGETDGRAIVNRNDAMPELKRMVKDNSAYYLLGYTSSVAARDGKFHEIQVRVKRKDVDVRARKGYWAYSAEDVEKAAGPSKPAAPKDVTAALESLAAAVEPGRNRKVAAWLGAAKGPSVKPSVTFAYEVPPGVTPDSAGETVAQVRITATSIYGDRLFDGIVPRDETATTVAGKVTFEAPAGGLVVRVVAENARGTRLDTDEVQFEVPDFTATRPQVTTPFVYRGRTARDLQQVRAAAAPLPAATRAFTRADRLLVRFDAYGPAGIPPTITLKLLNRSGDVMASLPAPTKRELNGNEFELGLSSLPPGDYMIEIAAAVNGEVTRHLLAIRVTG